ncbi:predicted protein [Nematostella vectensis]|uniref:Uncharacterized protein n=1 Tax=Nematostella vectensis TaxID=45351 RepID=A7RUA4_NEMVE|nr:uncharacterized protein LOC5517013 [Nematostella vectensis]EDO45047.1 predicted protein [Nematostella vectensis]|eukprot:XP_001637110.1 predicted protein [Nematostella vectensis]
MAAASVISSSFRLEEPDLDKDVFFNRLIKLDVNDQQSVSRFLDEYKFRKLSVSGLNRVIIFSGREATALFDEFTLEIWKKYYIQEDVAQIAILQGSQPFPLEGLFIGKSSGKVFVCQESDDYQEQKITCIGYSMEHFLTVGPQRLLEYNKPQCLFENCYGCFDPLIKDRVFSSMGLQTKP